MANNTQVPQSAIDTLNNVKNSFNDINNRIKTEGITDSSTGKVLIAPTITSDSLSNPQNTVNVPEKKSSTDWASIMAGINAQNSSLNNKPTTEMPDYMKAYLGTSEKPQNTADLYNIVSNQVGIDAKTQAVNDAQAKLDALNADLQGITAEATQAKLTLEQNAGGKDVTTSFLGREQQEVDRKAAIKALPLQVQILGQEAIVKNNTNLLNSAQKKLDTYFGLVRDDATNTYNYNKDLRDKVFQYADKQEQRMFNEKDKQETRDYNVMVNNLNQAQTWATTAIDRGQSDLAGKIMGLDPKSKTYQQDLADLAKQIKEKTNTISTPSSYNEWILAGGKAGTGKSYAEFIQSSKAPTQAEQTVSEYAARIEQSNPIISTLQPSITKMNPLVFETQLKMPSYLQSAEIQQYVQAASNFINAKLRRESGAVISPTEFSEARSQYLPKPGDSEQTLKNKADNRNLVYASLKKAAGAAYSSVNDLLNSQGTTIMTDKNGKQWNVPNDKINVFKQNGYK